MQRKALLFSLSTMVLCILGSCVGFIWGLSTWIGGPGASLWALGWTAIGSVQGACVAPAWYLGLGLDHGNAQDLDLRFFASFVLGTGSLSTSMLALVLWQSLGQSVPVSLSLGLGLSLMCATPLCAFLLARREIAPSLPVTL
jgi:hypothetical protein